MRLESNIIAPHFNMKDIYGREIDLNNYKEKKLLIAFFRHAGCPFCNLRVHVLKKISQEMKEKGLEMIFFFESKEKVLQMSIFHQEVSPIPLISDSDKKVYSIYGIENSVYKAAISHLESFVQSTYRAATSGLPVHLMKSDESFSTMPAEFLIDKGLIIKAVHYSDRLNDRMNIDKVIAFAEGNIA